MKFTQRMFGTEWNSKGVPGLPLRAGQMRAPSVAHNGGWYNAVGEKIGWGDLGKIDVDAIRAALDPEDVFIVLYERDSWWDMRKQSEEIKKYVEDPPGFLPTMEYPGLTYVMHKTGYIIAKDGVFIKKSSHDDKTGYDHGGVWFNVVAVHEIENRIRAASKNWRKAPVKSGSVWTEAEGEENRLRTEALLGVKIGELWPSKD